MIIGHYWLHKQMTWFFGGGQSRSQLAQLQAQLEPGYKYLDFSLSPSGFSLVHMTECMQRKPSVVAFKSANSSLKLSSLCKLTTSFKSKFK